MACIHTLDVKCAECSDPKDWTNAHTQKYPDGTWHWVNEPECTLRDQFAMAALTGLVASFHSLDMDNYKEKAAVTAYEYADAMLAEREKKE